MLLKAFKYFDLDNSGNCSKKEFIKAINKIGITGLTEENLMELFDLYDIDKSGELDYKEFVGILFNNHSVYNKKKPEPQEQVENQSKRSDEYENKSQLLNQQELKSIIKKIRSKLSARGVRGISSVAKTFVLMDSNNSHVISFDQFKTACKKLRFDLTDEEVEFAFQAFDKDNSNGIDYDEFLRAVRGEMV